MAKIVVVGASQGGVIPLVTIVKGLPKDFPAPILIVLHIGAARSMLPQVLNDTRSLPAVHARHGEELLPGHVYVAPPDRHMVVTANGIELNRGPRENWARPAIDPLFRSAAEVFGPEVIGVILSGRLNDGTSGLYEIKRRGGLALVQDPEEAEAASMPQSAMDNVSIDYSVPVAEIPALLNRLVREEVRRPMTAPAISYQETSRPVALICPECGGAMREETLGRLTRFRCHIGHAMTAEVMAAAQIDEIEKNLSTAFRTIKERVSFCEEMAGKYAVAGDDAAAKSWKEAATEAQRRQETVRDLLEVTWDHPEASGSVKTETTS